MITDTVEILKLINFRINVFNEERNKLSREPSALARKIEINFALKELTALKNTIETA
jgi:hypothetical protein